MEMGSRLQDCGQDVGGCRARDECTGCLAGWEVDAGAAWTGADGCGLGGTAFASSAAGGLVKISYVGKIMVA